MVSPFLRSRGALVVAAWGVSLAACGVDDGGTGRLSTPPGGDAGGPHGDVDAGPAGPHEDAGLLDETGETGDAGLDAGRPYVPTTVDQRIVPLHPVEDARGANPAAASAVRDDYLAQGYGEYTWGPGLPYMARTLDDGPAPAWGPRPRRLTRFAHLSDLQLADDESTSRVGSTDSAGLTSGALRTQDPYLCHMAGAAVRAINRLDEADPIEFTLLGGDNIDNAQANELAWLVDILNGGRAIECDSGADDDLVPGPGNDAKDAFLPEGLRMPWLWVSGNHDELVQGNFAVSSTFRNLALGAVSPPLVGGTRDYARFGDMRTGSGFVADSRREPMTVSDLLRRLADTDDGHGIGDAQLALGKAFYHYDVPGAPVRIVVMDTAAEAGGASGMLRLAHVEQFVLPAIEEARDLGRFVVLASHHAIDSLTLDGGAFGSAQEGALLPDDFRAMLGSYDHVLFSLVGHSHVHDVRSIQTPQGHAYWEVMTAAIADYPHELRTIELWDGDNGHFMLRATAVGLDTEDDPLAEQGRAYGIVDYTTGWSAVGVQPPAERINVELWIKKPGGLDEFQP